jgi:threonine/homoserine/homoserine lactone efflux protein
MTAAIVAGLLAGYGIAVPVGAVGAYLVALTARTSLRTGAAAALGVATVDGGYALVAMLGGGALWPSGSPSARSAGTGPRRPLRSGGPGPTRRNPCGCTRRWWR